MLNNDEQKDVRAAAVGISVSIKGEISGSEDLTIDGQVELLIGPRTYRVAAGELRSA